MWSHRPYRLMTYVGFSPIRLEKLATQTMFSPVLEPLKLLLVCTAFISEFTLRFRH